MFGDDCTLTYCLSTRNHPETTLPDSFEAQLSAAAKLRIKLDYLFLFTYK